VLAARRGLGVDEQRLAMPWFVEAVRWAVFAEALSHELRELREVTAIDPPDSLSGADRSAFIANRTAARERVKDLESALYPEDES